MLCDLVQCIEESTFEAFCTIKDHVCNDDILCENPKFLKAVKAFILEKSIENANNRQAFNDIVDIINLSKTICKCC